MSLPLIGPDGKSYTLQSDDPADLAAARAQGFHVETEQSPHDLAEQTAQAGIGGLARGATFGLSDAALAEGSPEYRHSVERLKEEHPVASGVGEVAGMLASPINAIGAAVEGTRGATALARIGKKALGGGAIGALAGAGSTIGDAALQDDPQLTAEKLIAHAGLGALLGGVGSGLFGAVEEGAGAALSKLGSSKVKSTLEDFANDKAVAATRATQAAIKRVGEDRLGEVGQVLRDRGHLATPEKMVESLEADVSKTGATKGAFLDAADKASKPDFAAALSAVDDFAAKLSPLEREAVAPGFTKARSALEDIATDPKAGTWRAFDKWKRDLQAMAKFSRGAAEDDLALGLRRQLAGVAREELDRQLVPALGAQGSAFLESKRVYGLLKDAQKLAESGAGRAGGIGFKDLLFGSLVGGGHFGGIPAAVGAKFMREQGPAVVAKLADAIAKSPALSATAKSFAQSAPALASRVGPYGGSLMEALSRGPAVALATHMTMAQVDPGYASTAHLAGLEPESPEQHEAAITRASDAAALGAAARDVDATIDRHIEHAIKGGGAPNSAARVLGKQDFGAKRMRREASDAHDQRAEEIRQFAGDPNALLDRVSKNLGRVGPVAPGAAAALTSQANVAVQFLAKAAERPVKPGPLARDWVPTEAERHDFTQKLQVVEQPLSVLKHAAAGTLTQAQVDALRTVYPGLAKAIADKALMRVLAEKPSGVPYRQRLMLSLLTGVDLDGTSSSAAIASNQLANRATKKQQENAAPKSSGARSEMTLAARTALPQQRRELESE